MAKIGRPLPLFDEVDGLKERIEQALNKVRERPAIALIRVETSCERGGYGIYVLANDRSGREILGGIRIDDPEDLELAEVVRGHLEVLGAIDDLKALMRRAGLRPRVFKFRLQAKAS